MDSYKDLNIDRDVLKTSMKDIASEIFGEQVDCSITEQKQSTQYIIHSATQECMLQVFFNKKGTTTLYPKVGKNQELSTALADALIKRCLIDEKKNFSLTLKDMGTDKIDLLIRYLKESDYCLPDVITTNEKTYIMKKIQGKQNDSLIIKLYTNGSTQFQGKPLKLYKEILYYFNETCHLKEVISTQEQFYDVKIDQTGLDYVYATRFKNSATFLGTKLKDIILPSLVLQKMEINVSDYSLFAFPILKGLEGYIKKLFLDHGITIPVGKDGFGPFFMSIPGDDILHIELGTRKIINNEKFCIAIETAYHFYRKQRHILFHVDSLVEPTKILDTKDEAERLIDSAIEVIENTFSSLL